MKEECYFCDAEKDLEEHHIFPVRKSKVFQKLDNIQEVESEENKVTVCHSCHMKLEKLYDQDFYQLMHLHFKRRQERKEERNPKELHKKMEQADEELDL